MNAGGAGIDSRTTRMNHHGECARVPPQLTLGGSRALVWTGRVLTGLIVAFLMVDAIGKLIPLAVYVEGTRKKSASPSRPYRPLGLVLALSTALQPDLADPARRRAALDRRTSAARRPLRSTRAARSGFPSRWGAALDRIHLAQRAAACALVLSLSLGADHAFHDHAQGTIRRPRRARRRLGSSSTAWAPSSAGTPRRVASSTARASPAARRERG